MNNKTENYIDVVMESFDFSKVLEIVKILDMEWSLESGESKVPNEGDLRTLARNLLEHADAQVVSEQKNHYYASSCGFVARKYHNRDLELEFVISSFGTNYLPHRYGK